MNRLFFSLSIILCALFPRIHAQTQQQLLAELVAENESAVQALVLYPEETRLNILEVTKHPEALIRLESIQSQTSESFRKILEAYPQSTQEMIWDLTRYPDLVNKLVDTGENSSLGVEKVLDGYPEIIHERARNSVRHHYRELVEINELDNAAKAAFYSVMSAYPPETQSSLQNLLALPEVLTILTENIRLTVLIGDLYNKEPQWVIQQSDSMALEAARANAQELKDWEEGLIENPEVREELKASAENFADEYGYDDDYYEYEGDDLYYDENETTIVHHYYYDYHYPYWFGYPYWYYYPRWRAYPYWYDWGFYIGPGNNFVVIGLPSFYFTHWYFYHPYHHLHYPHLSTHFTNHYYGHRNVGSSIYSGVSDWRSRNQDIVTDEWLRDDGRLSERFREYAEFEADRAKYNQAHPEKAKSQKEYVERYSSRYPNLSKTAGKNQQPSVRTEPKVSPRVKPVPKTQPQPPSEVKPKSDTTVPKVKKGTDYHRDVWERTKPKTQPKVKKQTPRVSIPKTNKSRTVSPRTKTGSKSKKKN